jgi:predicted nucleotidyltransferase
MHDSSIHYKILNFKYLPTSIRKLSLIFMNWTFQGILYADKTEKAFRVTVDIILTMFFASLIPISNNYIDLFVSFLISHSLNWIFNGQLFVLAKNVTKISNNPQKIISYANKLKERSAKEKSINCMLLYGSLVRGEINPTSDLDVRIIRKPGILNGLRACIFGSKERSRAFFSKFPLDMYIIDSPNHLSKMRDDEVPDILYDPNNILRR